MMKHLWNSSLIKNVIALYGVHFVQYLAPLITVPYLARVLGPHNWGYVAFAHSFAIAASLIVGYGFDLAGTREVARNRSNSVALARIFACVLGAKMILTIVIIAVTLILSQTVGPFVAAPAITWAGLIWGLTLGLNALWYFQGLERMRLVAIFDVSTKLIATAGVFLVVHQPEDAWLVLALQAIACGFSLIVSHWIAFKELKGLKLSWNHTKSAFQMGWSMFVFRGGVTLYTAGNPLILGLFVTPEIVGYYAGAEKIARAFVGLFGPIGRAIYPRLSHLAIVARDEAAQLTRNMAYILGSLGLLMGFVLFFAAPILVRLLLGEAFGESVVALKVLSALPLLIALSGVLGIQWMLPLGLDRPFNAIIICGGILNVILALLLVPVNEHAGMACAVVSAEFFVTGGIVLFLKFKRIGPVPENIPAKRETAA